MQELEKVLIILAELLDEPVRIAICCRNLVTLVISLVDGDGTVVDSNCDRVRFSGVIIVHRKCAEDSVIVVVLGDICDNCSRFGYQHNMKFWFFVFLANNQFQVHSIAIKELYTFTQQKLVPFQAISIIQLFPCELCLLIKTHQQLKRKIDGCLVRGFHKHVFHTKLPPL